MRALLAVRALCALPLLGGLAACSGLWSPPRHTDRELVDHWEDPVSVVSVDAPLSAHNLWSFDTLWFLANPDALALSGEDVLAMYLMAPHGSSSPPVVRCAPEQAVRASRGLEFGPDQRCIRIDKQGELRMISELGLEGTAQRAGEQWDFSSLRSRPGRVQVVRAEPLNGGGFRRTVLSDHALAGEAVPVCTRRPPLSDVPNDVAARCGRPPKGATLAAVVMPDGTVAFAEIHGTVDPAFASCAVAAAQAAQLFPTGCPPLPLLIDL